MGNSIKKFGDTQYTPRCGGCRRNEDLKRIALFFKAKVHPASVIDPDLPVEWHEEYLEPRAFCTIKCPRYKCQATLEL